MCPFWLGLIKIVQVLVMNKGLGSILASEAPPWFGKVLGALTVTVQMFYLFYVFFTV